MIDLKQYRELILRPSLKQMGMYSRSADILVLGTGLIETRMTHIKQLGDGPAIGFFQNEPVPYLDVIKYLYRNPKMAKKLLDECEYESLAGTTDRLLCNIKWATLICRIFYWRFEEPLPESLEDIAQYWKDYYNTHSGKGDPKEFVRVYNKYALV